MRRVLLLNVTYEPLTTVGLRRAVCLVLGGKAEVVHDDAAGAILHAASVALATPSVIRLSRYVRVPYRNRVPLTRAALMRRDNYRCAYCGRRAETIDHVIPRSRGGQHAWENCVASCTICNHRKADRLLDELGWTLAVPPAVPRGAHWRLVGAQHDGDPQWAAYLREPSAALKPSAALGDAPGRSRHRASSGPNHGNRSSITRTGSAPGGRSAGSSRTYGSMTSSTCSRSRSSSSGVTIPRPVARWSRPGRARARVTMPVEV